jgi:hypothetical protein
MISIFPCQSVSLSAGLSAWLAGWLAGWLHLSIDANLSIYPQSINPSNI